MFENPGRDRQARNFTTNVPKILNLKSFPEQIFSENCHWVPLNKVVDLYDVEDVRNWRTISPRRKHSEDSPVPADVLLLAI